MRTIRLFLPLALAAALALTACGSDENAATVNGSSVTNAEFQREQKAFVNNTAYLEAASQQGASVVSKRKLTPDFSAAWLTQLINYQLTNSEFAKRKLSVSDADRAEATTGVPGLFQSQAAWEAFPQWFKTLMIERQSKLVALTWSFVGGRKTDDAAKRAYFDSTLKRELTSFCVEHILLDKGQKYQAQELSAQLKADPSKFADEAKQKSKDPGSGAKGGDLGCGPSTQYVAPFAKAVQTQPVGQIGDPVESQFGFHIIRVRSIEKEPTFEEVAATFDDQVKQNAVKAFNEWFNGVAAKADVTVDSSYGKFVKVTEQGQTQIYVSPKPGPTTTLPPGAGGDLSGGGQVPGGAVPGGDLSGGGQVPGGDVSGGDVSGGEAPAAPTPTAPTPNPGG
ncbi:MAG: peptidylprolyl isomerase [Acidimicrobiia bacterium]